MDDPPKNIAASVRQRPLNLSRAEEQAFDVVLEAFGIERFINRLSISARCDRFVLKGGMPVTLWTKDRGRFTIVDDPASKTNTRQTLASVPSVRLVIS